MTSMDHLPLVRTSERGDFKRCRWRWHLGYNEGLRPKVRARALRFGLLVHSALELYYIPGRKRGDHPVKTFLKLYDEQIEELQEFGMRDDEGQWQDAREMGEDMLTRYVDHWREEDKLWEIVAPEIPALVVVSSKGGKPLARYLLQFDIVIFHHGKGRHLFVDHKTAKSIPDPEEKELDEQCGAYWTFGPDYLKEHGYLKDGVEISGFIYNYLRKAVADDRPRNERGQYLNQPTKDALIRAAVNDAFMDEAAAKKMKMDELSEGLRVAGLDPDQYGEPSKSQPPPYFTRFPVYRDEADRENVLYRVRAEIHEMNLAREGKLGIYKNPMFGGVYGCPTCPFYDACTIHESGGDWRELLSMTHEVGDPYEQYRDELDLEEF